MTKAWGFPLFLAFAICSFSPFRAYVFEPSLGELLLVAAGPAVLLGWFQLTGRQLPRFPILGLLILGGMFVSASMQQFEASFKAFKMPITFCLHGVLYLWGAAWLQSRGNKGRQSLNGWLVLIACANACVCMVQMVLGPITADALMPWGPEWTTSYEGLGFRTYGLLDNPLLAGSLMTICLPLALERALQSQSNLRWVPTCIIAVGILFTGSRSCMVVAAMLSASLLLPSLKPSRLVLAILPVAAALALILATPFASRFLDLLERGGDGNLQNRLWATTAALEMIGDNPVLGVGPGMFAETYGAHYKPVHAQDQESAYTTDNLLVQLAAESGLPAAILAFAAWSWMLMSSIRHRKQHSNGLTHALMAYGLLSMMVVLFATPVMWLLMALFASCENGFGQTGQTQEEPPLQSREQEDLTVAKVEIEHAIGAVANHHPA